MGENDSSSGKVVDLPGMAVVVVPTEAAEKIAEIINQELKVEDDTSGYFFRGVGHIGMFGGALSAAQPTPTGQAMLTSCHLPSSDDTGHPDADTIEAGV